MYFSFCRIGLSYPSFDCHALAYQFTHSCLSISVEGAKVFSFEEAKVKVNIFGVEI